MTDSPLSKRALFLLFRFWMIRKSMPLQRGVTDLFSSRRIITCILDSLGLFTMSIRVSGSFTPYPCPPLLGHLHTMLFNLI